VESFLDQIYRLLQCSPVFRSATDVKRELNLLCENRLDFIYLQSEMKFSFRNVCDVKRDLLHNRKVQDSLHVRCTPNTENSVPFGSKDYIYEEALLPFWLTHRLLLACCRKLRLQKRFVDA
jgi:hypothetical protein